MYIIVNSISFAIVVVVADVVDVVFVVVYKLSYCRLADNKGNRENGKGKRGKGEMGRGRERERERVRVRKREEKTNVRSACLPDLG